MRNSMPLVAIGLILACLLFVCCGSAFVFTYFVLRLPGGRSAPSPDSVQSTEVPALSPSATSACPATMEEVIRAAQGSTSGPEQGLIGGTAEPESVILVRYRVTGDEIASPFYYGAVPRGLVVMQQDMEAQVSAWKLFETLVPRGQRSMVSEYIVFTDGPGNRLAAVQQSADDPDLWSVQVDPADIGDRFALTFTLVHEFGHLLTLNASQVPPDQEIFAHSDDPLLYKQKVQACSTYFPGEGCSLSGSYINAFYDRFWTGISADWQAVDSLSQGKDLERYYEALYAFYEAHQDQFVDDYAATDPTEDMAETFTYFVFSDRPAAGTTGDQKILLFYEYPELVTLREDILAAVCEGTP